MTKPNYVHTAIVSDTSGSMIPFVEASCESINSFLHGLSEQPGKTTYSIYPFASVTRNPNPAFRDVLDRQPYHFNATGGTALIDAIDFCIVNTGSLLNDLPEDERPSEVIIYIDTDGQENSSKGRFRNNLEGLRNLIKHQEEVYGWKFIFTSCNRESFLSASTFGFSTASTLYYSQNATGYNAVADISARMVGSARSKRSFEITPEERLSAVS